MPFLLILASALASVIYAADGPLDVSTLKVGPARTIADLDLGKLGGWTYSFLPSADQQISRKQTARRKYTLMVAVGE